MCTLCTICLQRIRIIWVQSDIRSTDMQGTTEAMSYNAIFSPLIRRSELYCSPVLLLGSISSGPRSMLHHYFGLKPKHGCVQAVFPETCQS